MLKYKTRKSYKRQFNEDSRWIIWQDFPGNRVNLDMRFDKFVYQLDGVLYNQPTTHFIKMHEQAVILHKLSRST